MIFIERYPLKRCQVCVKLIASKVNCFLNINDLSEVQLCMSSNSWTWECPHTKDGADHVPLILLSSVFNSSHSYTYIANTFGVSTIKSKQFVFMELELLGFALSILRSRCNPGCDLWREWVAVACLAQLLWKSKKS